MDGRTGELLEECGHPVSWGAAARTKKGRSRRPFVSALMGCYGQLDVRVTLFEVIGMPGIVGALSESAEVPVAVAE